MGPKTAPKRPQDASKNDLLFTSSGITAKNPPEVPGILPKRPPDPPKTTSGGLLEAPGTPQEAPGPPQDPSWGPLGGLRDPPDASKTPFRYGFFWYGNKSKKY